MLGKKLVCWFRSLTTTADERSKHRRLLVAALAWQRADRYLFELTGDPEEIERAEKDMDNAANILRAEIDAYVGDLRKPVRQSVRIIYE